MPIPGFRKDGYLPVGLHRATEPEALFRFGSGTRRRRILSLRLRQWLKLARAVGALRFLLDGSFVTSKSQPGDLDAVILLPPGYDEQVKGESKPALVLYHMATQRRPEDLFVVDEQAAWDNWSQFFMRTREADGRRKGIVENLL